MSYPKCHCGYQIESDSEMSSFELCDCARAIRTKVPILNTYTQVGCTIRQGVAYPPLASELNEHQAVVDQYVDRHTPKNNGKK